MPSLKDLRNRISTVQSTQKITKAMQMVAAAKLRRAQEAAEAARPYAERMGAVLANLSSGMEGRADAPELMVGTGKDEVHLLLVATAERGLAGPFNSSIARLARQKAESLIADGKTVKFLFVGKKGYQVLRRRFPDNIVDLIDLSEHRSVNFPVAQDIARRIVEMFEAGEFDICTVFYSEFESVITQVPTALQVIPATVGETGEKAEGSDAEGAAADLGGAVYEYEPEESEILAELLPRNLAVQIFRALLENAASEQGARMTAMDNATRNAGELIDDLTLQYNRTRQAQITKELIEIISGAEAL